MNSSQTRKAILVLESGRSFEGLAFGAPVERLGEAVFNTSMTGYQEILTDPSYKGQIIVMTEPHIGNVGINAQDVESTRVFCEGLVVRENSPLASNWRSEKTLDALLKDAKIPGLYGVDTRAIVLHLRQFGAMRGILSTTEFNVAKLLKKVKDAPLMNGQDLVKSVTAGKSYVWQEPQWRWEDKTAIPAAKSALPKSPYHVVVLDYGAKHNILRCLASRVEKVTVLPADSSVQEILAARPDGLMLSNGPGDPAAVTYAIDNLKRWIELQEEDKIPRVPTFGICLGHQLLGHALGGSTFKLKFGHRGSNHPVKDLTTGKIEITCQNHGFCVDMNSLPQSTVEQTHVNLNDGTLEGLRHKKLPLFSVQYHPESSAGPHDSQYLFDRFIHLMEQSSVKKVGKHA